MTNQTERPYRMKYNEREGLWHIQKRNASGKFSTVEKFKSWRDAGNRFEQLMQPWADAQITGA